MAGRAASRLPAQGDDYRRGEGPCVRRVTIRGLPPHVSSWWPVTVLLHRLRLHRPEGMAALCDRAPDPCRGLNDSHLLADGEPRGWLHLIGRRSPEGNVPCGAERDHMAARSAAFSPASPCRRTPRHPTIVSRSCLPKAPRWRITSRGHHPAPGAAHAVPHGAGSRFRCSC